MNTEEKYVLNDLEVKLTGRRATRAVGAKISELVEVTPANELDGTFKKWVLLVSLFKIVEAQ